MKIYAGTDIRHHVYLGISLVSEKRDTTIPDVENPAPTWERRGISGHEGSAAQARRLTPVMGVPGASTSR
jgi:hypothetical protein